MGEIRKMPVDILNIISPEKISVRVSDGNVRQRYYQLQKDLQTFCFRQQEEVLKTIDPIEGICLVKHGRSYYRGLVLPRSATPKVLVRLLDVGKKELFHPHQVFELPEVFAKLSAFSFTVCPSLNPGQHFLDTEKSLEILSDLLENVPSIYIEKRGEVEGNYEHDSIYAEISWTKKVCDSPRSPFYTREFFLSDELVKRGILISGDSKNNQGEETEEEVNSRAIVAEEMLPPNLVTVEPGSVVDCCVQALVQWNLAVVHLSDPTTRRNLTQICDCMETFASTFPRVENPRPGMLVSYYQQTIGWVRGKILEETEGNLGRQFLVSLLDYGTKERVQELENFRVLPQRLRQLPSLAVSVKLPHPKSQATSESVLFRKMEETILKHKKLLRVRILSRHPTTDHTVFLQGHLLDRKYNPLY